MCTWFALYCVLLWFFITLRPRQNGRHFAIWQMAYSKAISGRKMFEFRINFTEICSQVSKWQNTSIGSDNGLVPIRQRAIIWNNDGFDYSSIYASLGLNGLMRHVDRQPLLGYILVPCHVVKYLHLIWRSGTRRLHIWVPDLQGAVVWLKIRHPDNDHSNGQQNHIMIKWRQKYKLGRHFLSYSCLQTCMYRSTNRKFNSHVYNGPCFHKSM